MLEEPAALQLQGVRVSQTEGMLQGSGYKDRVHEETSWNCWHCLPAHLPVGLSVCPHVSAWLPIDGFSSNLILGTSMKIC